MNIRETEEEEEEEENIEETSSSPAEEVKHKHTFISLLFFHEQDSIQI